MAKPKLSGPVLAADPATLPLKLKYRVGLGYKRNKSSTGGGTRKSSQQKGSRFMTVLAAARRGRTM